MKQVLYRKKHSLARRRKLIAINEKTEDKECKTYVRKSFIYKVRPAPKMATFDRDPHIHIRKGVDTLRNEEKFSFRVKGSFLLNQGRHHFQVDFCHTLKIEIIWKKKAISPKKSVTLT